MSIAIAPPADAINATRATPITLLLFMLVSSSLAA
jgi:hypothetical protein